MNQQVNPVIQQVVRTQFQQQPNMGQQILINQASPQNPNAQRPQISQHIWTQQPAQIAGQQIVRHPVNVIQQVSKLGTTLIKVVLNFSVPAKTFEI